MLNQRLSQKLQQKLSPQQIQLMKLLQIPTANLEQRIEEELEANPALEEGDAIDNVLDDLDNDLEERQESEEDVEKDSLEDFGVEDYFDDDGEYPEYKTNTYEGGSSSEDDNKSIPFSVGITFHEFLLQQLGIKDLDDESYVIGAQIIGSIDDDGYLRRELINIIDDLAFSQNLNTDEETVEKILELVQTFEPSGVGARDLQECLLLQLRNKDSNPLIKTAIIMIEKYFEHFSKKHYSKLEAALDLDSADLKSVIDEVLKLNPKPGSSYSGGNNSKIHQYIIPDFTVKNENGELELLLNMRNAPDLKISRSFKDMYKGYKDSKEKNKDTKNAILFIKQKMDAAKWFIDAIKQRQQTMMLTMRAILDYQEDYFLTGDETQLKPMILKDIAEITNLDISTVSRVANSKYVQTEFGTILLKYFFSESMQNSEGDEVSTKEIKAILQEIIDNEDKRKPLSDQKLMERLKDKGYEIARRTVAKYREKLNIPVARLRKEL